jgi:hypothetical protein
MAIKQLVIVTTAMLLNGIDLSTTTAQTHAISLDSIQELTLTNVKAEFVTFKGRQALRVTDGAVSVNEQHGYAMLPGVEFQDGVIEVELAGEPGPGAEEFARGFVGIGFRMVPDGSRFECIYLRPTNGRAEDQLRRNHSVQYMSHPGFSWDRLRQEFPGKYETYVDLVPGEWTKVKIEVRADKARLYVHGVAQPTLVVNDLKQGDSSGRIGLWIGPGTVAHFANLRVSK